MSRWKLIVGGALAFASGILLTAGTANTYAALSDFQEITGNTVSADVWADELAACGDPAAYKGGFVQGTSGDDTLDLRDVNQAQIVMGLSGDDTIYGGNSGDCLVGGDGNDTIYGGNAKDILIGGAGDDYLNGDNAKDALDGNDGIDVCEGGNGNDTVINCESF